MDKGLFEKYLNKQCIPEEAEKVYEWLQTSEGEAYLKENIVVEEFQDCIEHPDVPSEEIVARKEHHKSNNYSTLSRNDSFRTWIWIGVTAASIMLLVSALAGCENRSISPFEESTATYSIYGALDLDKAPNYIRVKDLTIPFLSDSAKNIDVKVTFQDLQDGTSLELKDSIVNFSGDYTHNFAVDQQLEPEEMYKVTVEGPDGETVTSTATMPSITEVELSVDEVLLSEGEKVHCLEPLTFTYKNVPEPEYISMNIGFKHDGKYQWGEVGFVDQLKHADNTDEMFLTLSPRQLMIEVFFPPGPIEGRDPRSLSPTVECHELDSKEVRVRYIHFGPEWDRIKEVSGATNPTESPDVDNGLGFLGGYREGAFTFETQ